MREVKGFAANPVNEMLKIRVLDEPGAGGANHHYQIRSDEPGNEQAFCDIHFQNGPIKERGTNGVTQETLLAVCIDRLKSFQAGPYACRENAIALTKLEEAQHWLLHRTRERMERGVEGTTAK